MNKQQVYTINCTKNEFRYAQYEANDIPTTCKLDALIRRVLKRIFIGIFRHMPDYNKNKEGLT
jgi:hypothetical protein